MRSSVPTVRVTRHDRLQVEVKVDCPIKVSRTRAAEYRVEVWFLLPKVLGIGPGDSEVATLYEDLRSFTRLKTPAASLDRITSSDLHASPLARLSALARDGARTERWNRAVRQDARLLVRAYRSGTRELVAALEEGRGLEAVRGLLVRSRRLTRDWRALLGALRALPLEGETALGLTVCDEYLSLHVEHALLVALRALLQQGAGGDAPAEEARVAHVQEARAGIEAERAYRADQGWPTTLGEGSTAADEERYVAQIGRLKKYVSRVLYLRQRPSAARAFALHATLGLAAAIAMLWAIAVQIVLVFKLDFEVQRGASPSVVAMAASGLVLAYILKDRIKATLGIRLQRLLPRWLDDRWTFLVWRRGSKPLARVAERMELLPAERIPHGVERARRSVEGDPLARLYNEDALVYERTVKLYPRRARADFAQFAGLNDILRFHVARWCRTLGGPRRDVLVLGPDGVPAVRRLANRYIVDVLVRTSLDGTTSDWSRGTLHLSQRGIERYDGAAARTRGAELPFDALDDGD